MACFVGRRKEAEALSAACMNGRSLHEAPWETNWKGAFAGKMSPSSGLPKSLTQGSTQNWFER